MSAQRSPTTYRLIGFYVLYFMAVGITLPFVPGYLNSLGLSPTEIGILLAMTPSFTIFMPPVWGLIADRSGRSGLVLLAATLGALCGLSCIALAYTFWQLVASFALYASCVSSIVTLVDSVTLTHSSGGHSSYARIRLWGSIGFIASSMGFGYAVSKIDRRAILVPMVLMSLLSVWCGMTLSKVRSASPQGPKPSFAAAKDLWRKPEIRIFLMATTAHWIACAPYHGSLALHVTAMGLAPSVISQSAALAVGSEVLVMLSWPWWVRRFSVRTLLVVSFVASAGRWFLMSQAHSAAELALAACFHGLTFGVFYLACIDWMVKHTPASLRASGQALYAAATYGVGGMVGFVASGRVYDAVGGHALFRWAALLEFIPALVVFVSLRPAPVTQHAKA